MILSDNGDTIPPASGKVIDTSVEQETNESTILQYTRLFKRDIWCWVAAVQKLWWLFAIFPLLFAIIMFFFRSMTTTNVYVTNCALIRQELKDQRSAVLPPGYVSIPRSIIMNLFKTRAVLEETIKRLSLPYTAEQLFNNIDVKAERNSDYYFLSASSKDPTLAAALANTLADVFIEEYKKLIRKNLEDLNDSYVRTQNEFEKQLDDQNEKLKRVNAENNLTSIENDIAFNNQRLLQVEDQLTRAASTLESSKKAMYELQGELANTPEEVVTSRERSTVAEDELMRAETRLHEYEQLYAKNNPLLIQQRELVKKLKADIEKAREADDADDINKRVVVARNPAYTQILVSIASKKAEITTLTNDIKLNNEIAVQLRARRELLTALLPTIRQIETDIERCKSQIKDTKLQIITIRSFLERSFSDISIQEIAKAPQRALPRKRGVWAVVGFVMGVFLSFSIIFGCELFNLTVRSNVDVEQALKIPQLGMIPVLEQSRRADYYSALQTMISNGEDFFSTASPEHPLLVVFAPNKRSDLDERIKEEFCETLKIRLGCKYAIVSPITEEEFQAKQTPLLINDYLYQFTDDAPKLGKDRTVYFRLDDLSFISPLTSDQIQRIKTAYKSVSLIVWDLFEFELHRQLFSEIAHSAELTIIPMKYAKTSKLNILRILQFMKKFHVRNIVGLLFNVNNKHYNKVML